MIPNGHILMNSHFENDMKSIMRKDILEIGYPAADIDMDNVIYQYFVLHKRLVKAVPRKIEYADTFARPTDPNIIAGLELLEDKISKGENINPHLNRAMMDVNYKDGLLFDWNIYHFHLGTMLDPDGFIHRTGDLLYAYVTDDTLYAIQVAPHGHWSDKDFLDTIERNWAFLLEDSKYNCEELTMNFNSKEIGELRKSNINTIVQLSSGHTYGSIGGGILANGGSTEAQMNKMDLERYLRNTQERIKAGLREEIGAELLKSEMYSESTRNFTPIVHQFILQRLADDRINVVNITNNEYKVLDFYFPIPTLKKIIYG